MKLSIIKKILDECFFIRSFVLNSNDSLLIGEKEIVSQAKPITDLFCFLLVSSITFF